MDLTREVILKIRSDREKALAKAPIQPTTKLEPTKKIPTGSLALDYILDGGYGVGRLTLLWGGFGSMKSHFAMLGCKTAIDIDPSIGIAWLSAEAKPEPIDWKRIGVKNPGDNIKFYESSDYSGEDFLNFLRWLLDEHKAGKDIFRYVVVDSFTQLPWREIVDKKAGEKSMAVGAGEITRFWKANEIRLKDSGITMVGTNQIRANFNQYSHEDGFPGGKALEHVAATIIKLGKKPLQNGSGLISRARTYKNKLAPSNRITDITWNFDDYHTEISRVSEMPTVAQALGVFTNSKGEPTYDGNSKYFQGNLVGKDANEVKNALKAPELFNAVMNAIGTRFEEKRLSLIANDGEAPTEIGPRDLPIADPETGEIPFSDNDFDYEG